MHPSVRGFVRAAVERWELADRSTVEVGAYNVNGTCRDLFTGPYIGTDQRAGPGVDQVAPGHLLPFSPGTFGAALCLEMLEHDPTPWLTVTEIGRVLARGGVAIVTCRGWDQRGVWPRHTEPADYWRFSPGAVAALFAVAGLDVARIIEDPDGPGVLAVAVKP